MRKNDKARLTSPWPGAVLYAVPITALLLGLMYYWFAIADRYVIFLYYHDMGPLVPDTAPFSAVTASRYWMAGLVACGGVMVACTTINGAAGRVLSHYSAPAWWRVWAMCAVPLATGILAITMTANYPPLPFRNAASVTLATLVGLMLALMPGKMAAKRPGTFVLLAADGVGLMFILLFLINVEDLGSWIARGRMVYVHMTIAGLIFGMFWLGAMSLVRVLWAPKSRASGGALFLSGLCVSYLLMPLVHHVLGTDGYFYISDHDNFFAQNIPLQLATWAISAALAFGISKLRDAWAS